MQHFRFFKSLDAFASILLRDNLPPLTFESAELANTFDIFEEDESCKIFSAKNAILSDVVV